MNVSNNVVNLVRNKKLWSLLKAGSSKVDYPLYCQLICFDENRIRTCNGIIFTSIVNPEFDIRGSINIFVLEAALKLVPEDSEIRQEDNVLVIKSSSGFENRLSILDVEFPDIKKGMTKGIVVDEEIVDNLKTAYLFAGHEMFPTVYADDSGIYSTSGGCAYFCPRNLDLESSLFIDGRILDVLKPGYELGENEDGNMVMEFDEGFAVFDVYRYTFPVDKLIEIMNSKSKDLELLCNVLAIKEAVSKVSHIFFGEREADILIVNKNCNMKIIAESINGRAEIEVPSHLDDKLVLTIDSSLVQRIPDRFDVYTNKKLAGEGFLFFQDGDEQIIFRK